MDDRTLAAQYAQTGDLMDLCHNEAWLREAAHIEDEGQVEAGLVMQEYSQTVRTLPGEQSQQLRQQMQVQSILFTTLRQWMETWDLGAGLDDTYTIARRLIRQHLANLTPIQQAAIEKLRGDDGGIGNRNQLVEQGVAILSELFTPEDWQAMATAASHSISLRVLNAGQPQSETTVVSGAISIASSLKSIENF